MQLWKLGAHLKTTKEWEDAFSKFEADDNTPTQFQPEMGEDGRTIAPGRDKRGARSGNAAGETVGQPGDSSEHLDRDEPYVPPAPSGNQGSRAGAPDSNGRQSIPDLQAVGSLHPGSRMVEPAEATAQECIDQHHPTNQVPSNWGMKSTVTWFTPQRELMEGAVSWRTGRILHPYGLGKSTTVQYIICPCPYRCSKLKHNAYLPRPTAQGCNLGLESEEDGVLRSWSAWELHRKAHLALTGVESVRTARR